MHQTTAYISRPRMALWLLVLVLLFTAYKSQSQSPATDSSWLDVSKVRFSTTIYKNLRYAAAPLQGTPAESLPAMDISKPLPEAWRGHRVPPAVIEKQLLLKISLVNSSDSAQNVFFYPGAYFQKFDLFRISPQGKAELVPETETDLQYRSAFRLLQVPPGDSSAYVARLQFVRTSATLFYPGIVQQDFVESFINDKIQFRAKTSLITYLVSGVMLMMIIYSIAVFRLNRNKEFLYYAGYAGCLALLFFLKSYLLYNFTQFNFFFESFWDFLVQCLGVGCYFIFIRKFLDTKTRYPFLDKTFRLSLLVLLAFASVYAVLYLFTPGFQWINLFENLTKQFMLVIGLVFIIYGVKRWKDKLLRFLVLGNIWLLGLSIVSFLLIIFPIRFFAPDSGLSFLNSAIIYYEFGLVLELAYFLSGLAYKNRRDIIERTKERERLRLDNEKKELEKQMAILEAQQEERNRISADMHDELGSGVTAIRLMSEIVKTKMKETTLPEIDKISNSANDLITKMNTIIWTMTSTNDTVENLITYIRTYALDFFESTHVECEFRIPAVIPHIQLSGEKRRNIFLAVKEALNNVLKHAKAKTVVINVEIAEKLTISIQDDGVGVDFEAIRRFGNGLKNMRSRLERINGQFSIMNNDGALTQFEMSL